MSNVSELFDALHQHLADAQGRAQRLGRLLTHDLDETGRPSLFARPLAQSMLAASLIRASDAAADIGVERFDSRWVALVTVLHRVGSTLSGTGLITALAANAIATLLQLLQVQCAQLRIMRQTRGVSVLLAT